MTDLERLIGAAIDVCNVEYSTRPPLYDRLYFAYFPDKGWRAAVGSGSSVDVDFAQDAHVDKEPCFPSPIDAVKAVIAERLVGLRESLRHGEEACERYRRTVAEAEAVVTR